MFSVSCTFVGVQGRAAVAGSVCGHSVLELLLPLLCREMTRHAYPGRVLGGVLDTRGLQWASLLSSSQHLTSGVCYRRALPWVRPVFLSRKEYACSKARLAVDITVAAVLVKNVRLFMQVSAGIHQNAVLVISGG